MSVSNREQIRLDILMKEASRVQQSPDQAYGLLRADI
jgi:hypothetical protein